ncbi:MAG: toll/interleukin-1 receptor domain-containing protein [Pseudomonadota bacterium]
MRIFLSYASEHKLLAEQISESIKARGHRVFFDRNDLPAGDTYEDQIESAIARSNLLVFLISPESVSDGRFTRTELLIARKKWSSAKKRVLPVLIKSTPMEDVPNYLKTVTILEPEGSIPAETASAVQCMAQPWRRRLITTAVLASMMGMGTAAWIHFQSITSGKWDVQAQENTPEQRALFGDAALDKITFDIERAGADEALILAIDLVSEPAGGLKVVSQTDPLDYVGNPIAPGQTFQGTFIVQPTTVDLDTIAYSVCARVESGDEVCSNNQIYKSNASEDYPFSNAIDFTDEFAAEISHVEATPDQSFLVATENQLVRFDPAGGGSVDTIYDSERITALHVGAVGTVIAETVNSLDTRLVRLIENGGVDGQITVSFPDDLSGTFGEPISERVIQMTDDSINLWILTGDGRGAEGLAYINAEFDDVQVPPYFDEISFDLKSYRLRSGTNEVYTGEIFVTPSDLIALDTNAYREVSGHDLETVSCTTDILSERANLFFHDCDGAIYEAAWTEDRFGIGEKLLDIPGYKNDAEHWPEVTFFTSSDNRLFGGVSVLSNEAFEGDGTYETTLSRFDTTDAAETIFHSRDARILDIAATDEIALVVLENAAGARETITIDISGK